MTDLAAALQATTANLAAYIEQRAAEIADPRIAEADRSASSRVAELEEAHAFDRQRWSDLERELRRQLDAQLKQVAWHRKVMTEAGFDLLTGRLKGAPAAPPTTGRASAMSWERNQGPDLERLARMVDVLSGGTVHVAAVPDTGTDEDVMVVANVPLDETGAQALYERWWVSEDDNGDRLELLDVEASR